MKKLNTNFVLLIVFNILFSISCNKIKEHDQQPELGSLQEGIKVSSAIGYCASIAMSAFERKALPDNVTVMLNNSDEFGRRSWLIYVHVDQQHPLPFNANVGDITMGGIGDTTGGVISMLLANIDILGGISKLYGIYTIPVTRQRDNKKILTVFAKQDIVLQHNDTILNLTMGSTMIQLEIKRVEDEKATDPYIAVKQNVWFVAIDQKNTFNDVYDDDILINGGGQITEVQGVNGGVVYHALIGVKINYSVCNKNPITGLSLSQNFKTDGTPFFDLGNALLSFHNTCDGMIHVDFSSGKYLGYNGKSIHLGIQ